MKKQNQFVGMKGFSVVWFGQVISVIASSMTTFGMTLWMYKQTESATAMAIMQVAFIVPFLLLSPIAGALVDRHSRKLMMMVSDLGAVVSTAVILILYISGNLEFWHLYIAAVINGIGNTFQKPAYTATISTMVSKEQYGRANGMMELLRSGPDVLAPAIAGALLAITFQGLFDSFALILLIDLLTFFLAISTLLMVHIPQPLKTAEGLRATGNLFKESSFGFKYILERPSLLGIQIIYLIGNLFVVTGYTVYAPMVLARTGQDSLIYGAVQTASAIGGLVGGVLMSTWGGFKRRIHGILIGWMIFGFSIMLFGLGTSLILWIPAMVLFSVTVALVNTSGQSIWQSKVAPDLQGRVFATRTLISWFTRPIGPIIGGTLADYVMEPAMQNSSTLAKIFGPVFGTEPGAGMSLLIFFTSFGVILAGLSGYFIPIIRNMEDILPDHDQLEPAFEASQ
jgi:MFS transporter, DHA3 family, macrolide efflux protein